MPHPNYWSFLLRIWSMDDLGWRAVLEDPHTGERQAFGSLEALLAAIHALGEGSEPAADAGSRPSAQEDASC